MKLTYVEYTHQDHKHTDEGNYKRYTTHTHLVADCSSALGDT